MHTMQCSRTLVSSWQRGSSWRPCALLSRRTTRRARCSCCVSWLRRRTATRCWCRCCWETCSARCGGGATPGTGCLLVCQHCTPAAPANAACCCHCCCPQQAGNLALAKQHYRRALQRDAAACPPHLHLRLGRCFMASADAAIAADVYTACLLDERPATARAAVCGPLAACASSSSGAVAGGRGCASAWLGLGMAHLRLADYRCAT